jgi:hypothetical protein
MISVTKDIRALFGVARDQGLRPTCLSFATSDAHAVIRATPFALLSVEYLYYMAVQRSAKPPSNTGVSVKSITEALDLDGQPLETTWRYLPALPSPLSGWKPPNTTESFKRKMRTETFSVKTLVEALDRGVPSVLVIKISQAFHLPDADGFVNSLATDPDSGIHAVISVAYGLKGSSAVILMRNSWGTDWGVDGYGWVTADYLTLRTLSFSTVE